MQFAFTEEQTLLQGTVERFVADRYVAGEHRRCRAEPAGYSPGNWRELAGLGLFALAFSADDGGLGAGARDAAAVLESLGRGRVTEPLLEQIFTAARVLAELGGPAEKQVWLPRIIQGEAQVSLAHAEHEARFNLRRVQMRARQSGGHWLLSGAKSLVPWAVNAQQLLVSARDRGAEDDPGGIGFYLVAADAAGLARKDFQLTDGSRASAITFRDVTAGVRLPGSFDQFERCIDFARLAAGAEMLGTMSAIFHDTLEYLRTRKQFGAPLASFQALQHRAASLYVRLEQARSQVCRAALFYEHDACTAHTSIAGMKSYVGRVAVELGETCVHLHGGIGMSDELAVGFGFKRLLVLANLFGDPDADLQRFVRAERPGSTG